jgi:hypothetical protein
MTAAGAPLAGKEAGKRDGDIKILGTDGAARENGPRFLSPRAGRAISGRASWVSKSLRQSPLPHFW